MKSKAFERAPSYCGMVPQWCSRSYCSNEVHGMDEYSRKKKIERAVQTQSPLPRTQGMIKHNYLAG